MFKNHKIFKIKYAEKDLIVEVGKMAYFTNGSCLIRYGETVVHVAVTASEKSREGIDFFPLSVDFEERLYSVGKIPGSFSKREGKPSEKAVLVSRIIDRPIRPLFPKDFKNDVTVVCTVLSVAEDCLPEIAAMVGVSIALSISDIPWDGPISGAHIGYVNGEFVVNPSLAQRDVSKLFLTVASTSERVIMIEAGANEISDSIMLNAIKVAHGANRPIIEFINKIKNEVGKEKFLYKSNYQTLEMYEKIKNFAIEDTKCALKNTDKNERNKCINLLREKIYENFSSQYDEIELPKLGECFYKLQKQIVRDWILNEQKRIDGRKMDEIRPLSCEVNFLPRVHGSGLFSRGMTQVLTVVTLGPLREQQTLDGIDEEEFKRYMHHYNFPSYSVGETRSSRAPGRREIGHGALAERALLPVIPSVEDFPYSIRLVSEVVTSNGSTSQGAVCASTLALMDAGVPIKAAVVGVSCGLVSENDKWATMVDIQGMEDFFGDMDFKVAGTKEGITAIQMDLKNNGLTFEIIKEALEKTHIARNFILDNAILKTLPQPRKNLSKYAPKVLTMKIPYEKIREVIGSGGKIIQKICSDFDVKVDIEEGGNTFIMSRDIENCQKAFKYIQNIVKELKIGTIYNGKVVKIMDFGAFIEITPGREGLCHISQVSNRRIEKISDMLKIGDEVFVKIIDIDSRGKINLSIKSAF